MNISSGDRSSSLRHYCHPYGLPLGECLLVGTADNQKPAGTAMFPSAPRRRGYVG